MACCILARFRTCSNLFIAFFAISLLRLYLVVVVEGEPSRESGEGGATTLSSTVAEPVARVVSLDELDAVLTCII